LNFLFAWRYFKAKKSTNAINIISWVSVSAIILGTASLIIVLSVFNGLEDLVKSLYASFYSDLKISSVKGKFITVPYGRLRQLKQMDDVRNYSLTLEDKALLQDNNLQPVVLKGVDSNYLYVNGVAGKMRKGKFDLGTADHPSVILGSGIENALGIESDRSVVPLSVYVFRNGTSSDADPASAVSSAGISASGSFSIQQDFDNKYGITNLAFVQRMTGLQPDEYSAVEIALKDPAHPEPVKKQLERLFGPGFLVQTRFEQNQELYSIMRIEKWVIYCVLTLILVVAAFNMVGALTMLVLEKKKDIQVLKAMGANNGYIQQIFITEGLLLALVGGGSGMLLAVITCWLQVKYKLVPLQGDSFLIDYYPVKLIPGDFMLVGGTILVVALLASWFPSRKAALQPVDLRS
jgi:lipoprotein-releasing system permease protein